MSDTILLDCLRLGIQSGRAVRTARRAARREPPGPKQRAAHRRLRAAGRRVRHDDEAWRRAWQALHGTRFHGPAATASTTFLARLGADPQALIRRADAVLVHTSAGKDSVVALHRTVMAAKAAGCLDKVVVVHADLGPGTEWPGVRELAQRQAERYGLRFVVVAAAGGFLGMVEARGMWPDAARRLCTSTLKRDASAHLYTEIATALGLDSQALLLSVYGVRGGESRTRALKPVLGIDTRASSGRRLVLTWNIIHGLSSDEVWQEIRDQGLEYHPVYDCGLDRLSCVYCVIAPEAALILATRACFALGLTAPQVYTDLERRIGHTFKPGVTLGGIVAAARMIDALDGPLTWDRGDAIRRHLGEDAAEQWRDNLALAT
ncbi:phosphoadenosine phosphosulfate reductase domain-containing protein [Kitasatospora purpeofusca]|uniref:phosphoadenosine phosphosulfate reductase domain-containing protein n=1 Tax=Kitasatospora purpeofusca TaxID=67352 RepID=UPI0035E1EC6B